MVARALYSVGMIGEALDEQIRGTSPKLSIAPHGSGAFMDDAYIWGANPKWIQACLGAVEKQFALQRLEINTKKTMVDGGTFVRGQDHRMLGARSNHAGSRVRRDLRQPTRSHTRSAANGDPTRIGSPGTNALAAGGETDGAPEQTLRGALQLLLSPDKVAGPRCQAPDPYEGHP